ncbi:unnamed protein product [Caenorhabditis nigoni]
MESQFGKVVPMTEEEQLKFVVDVANHAKGITPPPPPPEVDPIHYVLVLAAQLPPDELKKPIINLPIPTITVPQSTFIFFKMEWKKSQKELPKNQNSSNSGLKFDPYKTLWDSLTQNQKENWSQMFINVKRRGEFLIAQNFARRAPSKNERDRESRKRKRDAGK